VNSGRGGSSVSASHPSFASGSQLLQPTRHVTRRRPASHQHETVGCAGCAPGRRVPHHTHSGSGCSFRRPKRRASANARRPPPSNPSTSLQKRGGKDESAGALQTAAGGTGGVGAAACAGA
jgi:hypothetical protein